MKHSILISFAIILSAATAGAQTTVTVTSGAGNATQTFYSLENGVQGTAVLADWDLAFEINSFNSSILVNTAKGLAAFETPVAIGDWATLTEANEANWTSILNSEEDWSAGALTNGNNLAQPDGLNLGWGEYNMNTHTVAGTKIYVVKLVDESYKKLRINSLATSTYSFTYSDMDGSNEQTASLVKTAFAGKNFGYFSFTTGTTLDLEPAAATWDLLFTKYTSVIMAPDPTAYPVAGVLQNKDVLAMQVDGVPTDDATWNSADLSASINVIGYDWKTFNMTTFQYEYATDRTYFVQDRSFNIWKVIFTAYGGSSTGDMTFTQELVSSTRVGERSFNQLVLYPNPATNGQLNMVLGSEVTNGQLNIMDRAGRLVRTQRVNSAGALSSTPVDLAGIEPGLYVVHLDAEGIRYTSTVVVE
ncbi:MAG: T9SS type A sorting domain-containing protein [Flavobacteriales bacterium]|nr:T9SS type A sorting domain-containing protein [Flavobacteriales bacterium]